MMKTINHWIPNPGSQTLSLESSAYELLISGTAGSAKSTAIILYPLRYINNKNFRGLILRKTFPELSRSILHESKKFYPGFGASYKSQSRTWIFPSGATVELGYLDADTDVEIYKSAEYSYIAFDEATSFTEYQYTYMFSRLRSSDRSLPIVLRAATNPSSPDHWMYKRFGPWLDPKSKIKAKSGQVLYYTYENDIETAHIKKPKTNLPLFSRQYIFAHINENPHLSQEYKNSLNLITNPEERARLRDGLWVNSGRGLYFKKSWFKKNYKPINDFDTKRIRYWDRAATEKGDWTVGLLLATSNGKYYVEDVIRFRGTPNDVEAAILRAAKQDGPDVVIGIEQDPASAGKFEANYYVNKLAGYPVRVNRVNMRKELRARAVSAQAEQGNFYYIEGDWSASFFGELESFPEGNNDDQVDSLSGAFNCLFDFLGDKVPETNTLRRDANIVIDLFEDDIDDLELPPVYRRL